MRLQAIPAEIEWLGVAFVLTTFLQVAERAWRLINRIIDDCLRRRRIIARRKAQQVARLAAKQAHMPPAAIGAEQFPANARISDPKMLLAGGQVHLLLSVEKLEN